jgi:hypothetical protein
MQCSWDGADPPGCRYWGFIKSVDSSNQTLVFDLARFESTGEEEHQFELINNNPLLRTLAIADEVVVYACPPAPGEAVPYLGCGNIEDYYEVFTVNDLDAWVDNGAEFWGLRMDHDEVAHIEQWWWP